MKEIALKNQAANVNEEEKHFEFGKNWQNFLQKLNEERILEAEKSLKEMLKVETLDGLSFLDIGCGSGLFSLAAVRLGASQVMSFDFDPQSVACVSELKRRFFPEKDSWRSGQGSALDEVYMNSLGQFDIVYSWGVLHHTGNMWKGLANAIPTVKKKGKLFIAIYNDQDYMSRMWMSVKKLYNRTPSFLKFVLIPSFLYLWVPILIRDLFTGNPTRSWKNYVQRRGMSPWYDVIDWVGGYPFEVARPEDIFRFYHSRGFQLVEMKTTNRLGNNEFVFVRSTQS